MSKRRPSTDLIPAVRDSGGIVGADEALPDLELAARYVDRLVEGADENALHNLRNQADAVRLYEQRSKNLESANHFARLKLLAEAGLGELSLGRDPALPTGTPIAVRNWRTVAIGHKRGVLTSTCDAFVATGRTITTTRVARTLERKGWTYIDAEAIQKVIDDRVAHDQISRAQLARQLGFYPTEFYPRKNLHRRQWPQGVRLATALGVDPVSFPPKASRRRPRRDGRPWWLVRERKRSGGKWDRAYGYFRQCLDQFQQLAPNHDPRWDEAYEHLYAIEQIIGRQLAKDRVSK